MTLTDAGRRLRRRRVEAMLDPAAQAVLPRVLDDADDLVGVLLVGVALGDVQPDRMRPVEEATGERFVDDADRGAARAILLAVISRPAITGTPSVEK